MAGTKRKRSKQAGPSAKRRKITGGFQRRGYSSVARTRGAQVTGEMKYFDTVLAAGVIPASTNWTATEFDPTTYNTLFAPIVGSGIDQRIGKSVKVMRIKIRGVIQCNAQTNQTAADNNTVVRCILHQDKQTNSAQAQGEQVMTNHASAGLNPFAFQNIDNFGRFRVLKDKTWIIQNPNMSYDGSNVEQAGLCRTFKWTIKFRKPVEIRFNNTNGGTVADIVDNSFHIIATTQNVDLAPSISYVSRVCYKE